VPEIRLEDQQAPATAFESLGLSLARAGFVALVLGLVESLFVRRAAGFDIPGLAPALAGLWLPASIVSLGVATPLAAALDDPRGRRFIPPTFALLAFAAIVFLLRLGGAGIALHLRALPLELVALFGVGTLAAWTRPSEALRRPLAIGAIFVVFALQLFATRWVDAHRGFAGVIVDDTGIPRLMLRAVLRRFA
jgi:hypothetical protein